MEENDYEDIDTDLEVEMERRFVHRDERIERIKNGIEHNETTDDKDEISPEEEKKEDIGAWKS